MQGTSGALWMLAMTGPEFLDAPPGGDALTDYDRQHISTYLRVLDAFAAGAQWEEVARLVFGFDPVRERERSRRVLEGHLARARWMSEHGYWELLNSVRH